jgi:ribosomal protein S6
MKKCALTVVEGGGIVRGIHNHGIRTFPHRFKAKYTDQRGMRYYEKGRFLSIYYDANPATMRLVEQVLTMDEYVLRNTHLKARSILDQVNTEREDRNPFIKLAEQQKQRNQKQQQQQQQQQNET